MLHMLVSYLHVIGLQWTAPVPAINIAQVAVAGKAIVGSHCSVVLGSITPLLQVVLAAPPPPLAVSSNVLAPFAQAPKASAKPMVKARRNWLFAVIAVLRISSTNPVQKAGAALTRPLQPPIRTPAETSSALQSVARRAFRSAG
jgi:hypothetical protein